MAIKKIHKIDANGEVTFIDTTPISRDKGTEPNTTAGTQDDCLAYGYKFLNSKCYAFNKLNKTTDINRNIKANNITKGYKNSYLGSGNVTEGSKNIIIGQSNRTLQANENIIIGKNLYAENNGELAIGYNETANRSKHTILTYSQTTTDALLNEAFIGGVLNNRYYTNTDYETAYAVEYTAVALNAASNEAWTQTGYAAFRYVNSTFTQIGHTDVVTKRDSNLDYAVTLASGSDYLKVSVQGEASHTAYWNVTIKLTEVRYG
mgnify:FL=1